MPNRITFFLCVLPLGFILGCGPKLPDGMPKLYPVTITVTQDGVPLADANLILSGGAGIWISTGTTDAQGTATPFTQGKYVGIPAGTFKVAVTKVVSEGEKPPPSPIDAESARVFQEYQRSGKKYRQFNLTPLPYRREDTTPLTVTIAKGAKNVTVDVKGTVKDEVRQYGR